MDLRARDTEERQRAALAAVCGLFALGLHIVAPMQLATTVFSLILAVPSWYCARRVLTALRGEPDDSWLIGPLGPLLVLRVAWFVLKVVLGVLCGPVATVGCLVLALIPAAPAEAATQRDL